MKLMRVLLVLSVCVFLASVPSTDEVANMTTYDLVLANGRILDGCGNPWFWGDLAVQDGRIAEIAPPGTLQGKQRIDIAGRFISPGFIDIHTHSDLSILVNRRAESAVRQGATTHVIGNCGMSPAPVDEAHLTEMRGQWGPISDQPEVGWKWRTFNDYLEAMQSGGLGINIAALAGHGALRIAAKGLDEGALTGTELDRMKVLLDEAMQAGSLWIVDRFGLPTRVLCQHRRDHRLGARARPISWIVCLTRPRRAGDHPAGGGRSHPHRA